MSALEAVRFWLIGAVIAAGFLLAWLLRDVLVLAFAAVVFAVLLDAAAQPLRRAGLGRTWSITIVCVALIIVLAAIGLLTGSQIRVQASELVRQLPPAIRAVESTIGMQLIDSDGSGQRLFGYGIEGVLRQALSIGEMAATLAASIVVILVGAVFVAAGPQIYHVGCVKLFPVAQHERVERFLTTSAHALRLWLLGQLVSMAIVGVLAGLGAWLIGLPAPLMLGLVAGLAEFIPVLGAILGAAPAVLLAMTLDLTAVLWTVALFLAIQQLESNVVTPVVQRSMLKIPPALLLFALVGVGLVLGPVGIVFAVPLTVVAFVAVKELYVRQTLGIPTPLPGPAEHGEA